MSEQKPVNLMEAVRKGLENMIQPPATPQEPLVQEATLETVGPDGVARKFHRASTPSPEGQTWQPIETAPKDGRRVLVMWEYWSSEPFVAYFKHGRWNGEVALSECSDDGPTHWMPLPLTPDPRRHTQP